jgi:DNA-binding MarR family transcriptional regulator
MQGSGVSDPSPIGCDNRNYHGQLERIASSPHEILHKELPDDGSAGTSEVQPSKQTLLNKLWWSDGLLRYQSMQDLADELSIKRTTAVRQLRALEDRGIIGPVFFAPNRDDRVAIS